MLVQFPTNATLVILEKCIRKRGRQSRNTWRNGYIGDRATHPLNTVELILIQFPTNDTLVIFVYALWNVTYISVTLGGMDTSVTELHPRKALEPILVTVPGRLMLVSAPQSV